MKTGAPGGRFRCKRHIETKGRKYFDKLKTNNKSMTEFCGNSVKTCNSAETKTVEPDECRVNAKHHYCTNESLHLDITHRYKLTIIFNNKLYDIYCMKRCLIFQDFLGEEVHSKTNLTKTTLKSRKLLSVNEESYS